MPMGYCQNTGCVFRLQGADVYRVLNVVRVSRDELPSPPPRINVLSALRKVLEPIPRATDLAALFNDTLANLEAHLDIRHAMIVMHDAPGQRLYTVASRGYAQSGVGSEIPLGVGVIGVAAMHRTPILIPHATIEYSYGRANRDSVACAGISAGLETAIPLPGLAEARSHRIGDALREREWQRHAVRTPVVAMRAVTVQHAECRPLKRCRGRNARWRDGKRGRQVAEQAAGGEAVKIGLAGVGWACAGSVRIAIGRELQGRETDHRDGCAPVAHHAVTAAGHCVSSTRRAGHTCQRHTATRCEDRFPTRVIPNVGRETPRPIGAMLGVESGITQALGKIACRQ